MYLCSTKYVQCKRLELNRKYFIINSFFFQKQIETRRQVEKIRRILQGYFQPKIGRKIGIFSPGRKNNIPRRKSVEVLSGLCTDIAEVNCFDPVEPEYFQAFFNKRKNIPLSLTKFQTPHSLFLTFDLTLRRHILVETKL